MAEQNKQTVDLNIDRMEMLAPVVAAQLTTAFYVNAVLRHLQGEKAENLFTDEALMEVNNRWVDILKQLDAIVQENAKKRSPTTP